MEIKAIGKSDVMLNKQSAAVCLAVHESRIALVRDVDHLALACVPTFLKECRVDNVLALLHLHPNHLERKAVDELVIGIAEHHIVCVRLVQTTVARGRQTAVFLNDVLNSVRILQKDSMRKTLKLLQCMIKDIQ